MQNILTPLRMNAAASADYTGIHEKRCCSLVNINKRIDKLNGTVKFLKNVKTLIKSLKGVTETIFNLLKNKKDNF